MSPEAGQPIGDPGLKELLQLATKVYEHKIAFNRLLGLKVAAIDGQKVTTRFDYDEDFVGNYVHKTLHGGVISAVLDATGGLTASVGVLVKMADQPLTALEERLGRVGTIDLRVDYLRPGRGKVFTAGGVIMRAGNKVAVTRMELTNETGMLIAVGTGTYLVG